MAQDTERISLSYPTCALCGFKMTLDPQGKCRDTAGCRRRVAAKENK